jgi:hypothetical protein
MKDRPSEQPPVQELIRPVQMHNYHYRFYYEILFRSGKTRGSVLLSAKTKNGIDRISTQLLSDPDSVCGAQSKQCTVFPEACSVSVEIGIVVNGTPKSVIWGSLLSNVVEHPHALELSRLYNGRPVVVKFDVHDEGAFRLPLLPGDHVTWN